MFIDILTPTALNKLKVNLRYFAYMQSMLHRLPYTDEHMHVLETAMVHADKISLYLSQGYLFHLQTAQEIQLTGYDLFIFWLYYTLKKQVEKTNWTFPDQCPLHQLIFSTVSYKVTVNTVGEKLSLLLPQPIPSYLVNYLAQFGLTINGDV